MSKLKLKLKNSKGDYTKKMKDEIQILKDEINELKEKLNKIENSIKEINQELNYYDLDCMDENIQRLLEKHPELL